jgi:hypothetical protein
LHSGYHHLLVIFEMFFINLVARHYYRRHVRHIPPEDAYQVETRSIGAETTNSLLRDHPGIETLPGPSVASSRRSSVFTVGLPDFRALFRLTKHGADAASVSSSKRSSAVDSAALYFHRNSLPPTLEAGTDPMPPPDESAHSKV